MIGEHSMDQDALTRIEARLHRVERSNRILLGLLFAIVAVASIDAATAAPEILTVAEIRAHRISLLDANGSIVADWYSTSPGSYHGPN